MPKARASSRSTSDPFAALLQSRPARALADLRRRRAALHDRFRAGGGGRRPRHRPLLGHGLEAALGGLAAGELVRMVGPLSRFTLEDTSTAVVMLAQGVGVMPFRSMLRHLAMTEDRKATTLVHVGARHPFRADTEDVVGTGPTRRRGPRSPPSSSRRWRPTERPPSSCPARRRSSPTPPVRSARRRLTRPPSGATASGVGAPTCRPPTGSRPSPRDHAGHPDLPLDRREEPRPGVSRRGRARLHRPRRPLRGGHAPPLRRRPLPRRRAPRRANRRRLAQASRARAAGPHVRDHRRRGERLAQRHHRGRPLARLCNARRRGRAVPQPRHVVRLRWFKIVDMDVYQDTQVLRDALARQARAGVQEAAAAPITSAPAPEYSSR